MSTVKVPLFLLLLFCLVSFCKDASCQSFVQGSDTDLRLVITGNAKAGFLVDIYNKDHLLVTEREAFSLRMYNTDLSTSARIDTWTGSKWEGGADRITLTRDSYIAELDANLSVSVSYEIVNANLVKKTIRLFQPSMPDMYYILDETSRPGEKPLRYITFEHDSFPGGLVHEMYPAAGWISPDNQVTGFLTDAGYLNQYTRTTRRRFSGRGGGFVGMRKLPDPSLYSIATTKEQSEGRDYVRQTFGELYNLDAGPVITIPADSLLRTEADYTREGNVTVTRTDHTFTLACHPSDRAGISMITPMKDQQVYSISCWCKGNTPMALKLYRVRNGKRTLEMEDGIKYIDNFPVNDQQWTLFKGSILVPYIEHDSVSMFIGTQSGKESTLQIRDLTFTVHQSAHEPYNKLSMGDTVTKTTFVFVEPYTSHKDFMIASQTRLAEGKGFKGTQIEKMLYGNLNMLTWIRSVNDPSPFNVPNMNYSPDMYNRDSYFSTVATYNKTLNLSIWNEWAKTQTPQGGIGTIITPYMGSVEAKDNEATIEWLIWAMLNKRRFGVDGPQDKIKKAVDYVLREFDSAHDGKCRSHFPMSQVDIIDYNPKTDRLAVNQGMLAIALRTIRELGYAIPESYIALVEKEYRNFYDPVRKHLLFDRKYPDIISLTDLEPEFFSLWLFNRPILTDEMVINHLQQFPILNKAPGSPHPEFGTTAPICVRITKDKKGYAYMSADYQPFEQFGAANYSDGRSDGYYYNGGSWMRAEYCAYVTGLKHGWTRARPLMENRIWAEINLNPKWPFSKEFIPTKYDSTDSWWESTKGLCWNVFILMADELAGLRTPDMDPDYKHHP